VVLRVVVQQAISAAVVLVLQCSRSLVVVGLRVVVQQAMGLMVAATMVWIQLPYLSAHPPLARPSS
jgi:hypothetical protein